jgi:hypothetical protein
MTEAEREKRINALFCAVSVLDGTGGGFSPSELSEARQMLAAMLLSEQQEARNGQ